MRGCWATAGEELKQVCHLGDVLWEGQRHSTLYPPQNTPGSNSYLSGAVAWACQADLGSKFFCLSDVNFTCLVIVLIFILPSPPPPVLPSPPLELITCSLHVSPGDFSVIIVGDSDWEGRMGIGFHKVAVQPAFCDIFISSVIYPGYSIWKQISSILFLRLKCEV